MIEYIEEQDQNNRKTKSLVLENFIGEGSFGKVFKVLEKNNNNICAAKILNEELKDETGEINLSISREIIILSKLDHLAVLKFILFSPFNFKHKPKPVIITEYASNGTLKNFIEAERSGRPIPSWNNTRKLIIAYGISSAMAYLHKNNIIHRDLKPDNILIDHFLNPKIADFGLSKGSGEDSFLDTFSKGTKGTPIYMSPEIWERNEYSELSDVYAYALILYELFTCERLFEKCHFFEIPIMVKKGYRPPFNKEIPAAYKDLIERCWRQIPYARPTFDQITIELKSDRNFITELVDEEEFYNYVKYIDEYESSFGKSKTKYFDGMLQSDKSTESADFKERITYSLKLFPFKEFTQLIKDKSRNLVRQAETDPEKQFVVGMNLVEGVNDFPRNVQLGVKYLKISYKSGNEDSVVYYIRMLIKGDYIPRNHKKAMKLLETRMKHNKSMYL